RISWIRRRSRGRSPALHSRSTTSRRRRARRCARSTTAGPARGTKPAPRRSRPECSPGPRHSRSTRQPEEDRMDPQPTYPVTIGQMSVLHDLFDMPPERRCEVNLIFTWDLPAGHTEEEVWAAFTKLAKRHESMRLHYVCAE